MILDAFLKLPASYWLILGGVLVVVIAGAVFGPGKRKKHNRWRSNSFRETFQPPRNTDPWKHEKAVQVPNWIKDKTPVSQGSTVDTSRWSLNLLQALEWHRFELVCTGYFEALGFRAKLTKFGPDGGVDIHLYAEGQDRPAIAVQCKAWKSEPIGVNLVRELYGVMARNKIPEGIFVTTGTYTPEARSFPTGGDLHLLDGRALIDNIRTLTDEKQRDLLAMATRGDFTTPTCASCGIKMVLRTPKKKAGNPFWGCSNYPRCSQTLQMSANLGKK